MTLKSRLSILESKAKPLICLPVEILRLGRGETLTPEQEAAKKAAQAAGRDCLEVVVL